MNYYRQCKLRKRLTEEVVWIPERVDGKPIMFGEYLKIDGDDGWRILFIGDTRMEESYLQERERDHLYQRRASDI